jgi:LuxR family maltose regulon positive regulatory protein
MSEHEFILKVTPPRLPRGVLERARLLESWTLARERTATAVVAPAGLGKTTLLLQWRRHWMAQGALVAWLGGDALDEPARFVQALLKAVRVASGRTVFDALAEQHGSVTGPQSEALTALLAEIALLGSETVLVVDEAERVPEATVRQCLQYLLLNAPANLHVVLGSRTPLPLQTSELAAKGNFAVLDTGDLRLRLEESIEILDKRLGARLDLDQQARLHDAVEGWPIALQLAIARIEREPSPAMALETFSARRGDIRNYFAEALFSRLPPAQTEFLVRVAPLEYLNAPLCEAVTQDPKASELLDRMIRDTPIVTVAGHEDWVRLHPLARDFLLHRFEQIGPAEQSQVHTRAAEWFAAHDCFHEAAGHALAAGDSHAGHAYAMRSLWALGTAGKLAEAREWLARIPPRLLDADLSTKLVAAWVFALGERNEDALQFGLEIAAAPATGPCQRMAALRVAGGAALFADRLGLVPRVLAQWPQDQPVEDPLYAVAPLNARAVLALHAGATGEARDRVARAVAYGHAGSLQLAFALAQAIAGLSHLWDGDACQAEAVLQPMLAVAEQEHGRRSVVACVYAAILAAAQVELDRPALAQALLANRLDVIENSFPDIVLAAYRALASIALRQGDERRALVALEGLAALAKRRQLPRLRLYSLAERVRIHAVAGRLETAQRLVAAIDHLAGAFRQDDFLPFEPQYLLASAIAKAYLALAQTDVEQAERQLAHADALAAQLRRGHDTRVVKVLRAVAAHRRDPAAAEALLAEAHGLAKIGGSAHLLADVHPLAAQMLEPGRTAVASKVAHATRSMATPLPAAAASRETPPRPGLLTMKEAEVLRLLDKGMSNKLIARTLDVSSETVKWHLKNLYQKLSAGTRRHAVDRARLLGLVGD